MSKPQELIKRVRQEAGCIIEPWAGGLVIRPACRLSAELAALVEEHKAEILRELKSNPTAGGGR